MFYAAAVCIFPNFFEYFRQFVLTATAAVRRLISHKQAGKTHAHPERFLLHFTRKSGKIWLDITLFLHHISADGKNQEAFHAHKNVRQMPLDKDIALCLL